jgi:protein-arginine kinase activator protein McsA
MRREMKEAVVREEYERAKELRDEIRKLEQSEE